MLDSTARLLGVSLDELSELALSAPAGADGLVLVPYFDGERTPNRPDATGSLLGLTHDNATPAHLARAAIEGLLCGLADGLDALREEGVAIERVLLVGGGARSEALRRIAPTVFGDAGARARRRRVRRRRCGAPGGLGAVGRARGAAVGAGAVERYEADAVPAVRARYAEVRELTARRQRKRRAA